VDEIAALLAVLAAVSFALAATLWQRASMAAGIEAGKPQGFARLVTNRVWLLGLGAQVLGVLLQAAALDRGRVAIIQPLLVTAVIWAMPLGYFLTNQTITWRHVFGAALVVAGLAVFASVGDPAGGIDNAPTADWAAAFLLIAAVCLGLLLFGGRGGLSAKAAVFGTVAGVLYGVSATLMKPVVEELHESGGVAVLESWELWVMAATGIVGFYLQQVSVANPVVSVLLGVLVLQERLDRPPAWHAVLAVGGLALALLGAVVVASASEQESEERATTGGLSPA
jgi:drug/metabolite transporter (DMT)-like permease